MNVVVVEEEGGICVDRSIDNNVFRNTKIRNNGFFDMFFSYRAIKFHYHNPPLIIRFFLIRKTIIMMMISR